MTDITSAALAAALVAALVAAERFALLIDATKSAFDRAHDHIEFLELLHEAGFMVVPIPPEPAVAEAEQPKDAV